MLFETRGSSLLSIFSMKPGEQGASGVWTGWKTQKAELLSLLCTETLSHRTSCL